MIPQTPSPPPTTTLSSPPPIMSSSHENKSHYISINNNELPSTPPPTNVTTTSSNSYLQPVPTPSTSIAHQYHHGLLSTLFEQFVYHILRHQPPLQPPHQLTPSGSISFKVEPIQLHINSSSPLLDSSEAQPATTTTTIISDPPINPPKQKPNQPPPPPNDVAPAPDASLQNPINPPNYTKHQKALRNAGSLANLLPTGTVLAFQALTPSITDTGGKCQLTNKVLIGCVIAACAIVCFCSSFTDSVSCNNKVYFGIASPKGLVVLNYDNLEEEKPVVEKEADLRRLRLRAKDFVHAFLSVAVFLIFAFSSTDVQGCFFPKESNDARYSMVVYLPLVAGILSSFFFTIFPTARRGIGYTT